MLCADRNERRDWWESTDPSLWWDSSASRDIDEPKENIEANDPTLPSEATEPTDPMLAESGLRAAGRWWAGTRQPDDPLVSPVGADLADLPPIDVYIGERDILRPAVDRFVDRARADGARVHVHEVAAMFHVWMTRAIPEARRTRRELARLVLTPAGGPPARRPGGPAR